MINALHLTNRRLENTKVVLNGAGAAGIACLKIMHSYGIRKENIIACDTLGVIFKDRTKGMNKWKAEFANATTPARTL